MRCLLAFLLPLAAWAGMWPDNFGAYHRVSAQPAALTDQPLWNEDGLQGAETARYEADGKAFTATAYRLLDSTGAMAAFEWLRPSDAKQVKFAGLAAGTKDGVLLVHGNYLLSIQGYTPTDVELGAAIEQLPRVEQAVLPVLPGYLPSARRVLNSERYVTGPVGLARFVPGIPPSVAAFHLGAEAQLGSFEGPGGQMKLVIFNYPTHQIAMQQYEAFAKLSGIIAKRTGPLIAAVLAPANPDAAERLLSEVRYEASVTLSERVPTQKDNIGDLVINAFKLIGFLLVFMTVSGLAFGGLRAFSRRGPKGQERDAMIVLDLKDQ